MEDVTTIVNIKTLKGRLITHTFNAVVGMVKSVEMKKSVTDQFTVKYRSETFERIAGRKD